MRRFFIIIIIEVYVVLETLLVLRVLLTIMSLFVFCLLSLFCLYQRCVSTDNVLIYIISIFFIYVVFSVSVSNGDVFLCFFVFFCSSVFFSLCLFFSDIVTPPPRHTHASLVPSLAQPSTPAAQNIATERHKERTTEEKQCICDAAPKKNTLGPKS